MSHSNERFTGPFERSGTRPETTSPLTPRIESLTQEESLAMYVGDFDEALRQIRIMRGAERDRLIMRLEREIGTAITSLNRTGESYVQYGKPEKAASYFAASERLSRFLNELRRLYRQEDLAAELRDAEGDGIPLPKTRH